MASDVEPTAGAIYAESLEVSLRILKGALAAGASDVHLRAGVPPMVRILGDLLPLEHPELHRSTIEATVAGLMAWAGVPRMVGKQTEFSCDVPDIGRFRTHVYRQRGTLAAVLRHIPSEIPDFAALRLPPVIKQISLERQGLVVITGATGNGKSTTIGAMLEFMNRQITKHIVTLEEPIEFVFQDAECSFSQREVGRDVESFREGLVGALREDPDVIFVGEVREPDEFEVALSAAEAGHLVLCTFHSSDAQAAITRMIHMYPESFRSTARERIAAALTAVVAQKLIVQQGGRERVLATEIVRRTPIVQECIRDPSRYRGLHAALEAGAAEYGTHGFDHQLLRLVRSRLISLDSAKAAARSPKDLVRALKLDRRVTSRAG
ncbi:MAG: PilT/PilU family type 4a pilus ATPase [Myxococcales bacterium]|nr:PilT/PilU family type 4a pilus ATPase [Myxococcales bacterium]